MILDTEKLLKKKELMTFKNYKTKCDNSNQSLMTILRKYCSNAQNKMEVNDWFYNKILLIIN